MGYTGVGVPVTSKVVYVIGSSSSTKAFSWMYPDEDGSRLMKLTVATPLSFVTRDGGDIDCFGVC